MAEASSASRTMTQYETPTLQPSDPLEAPADERQRQLSGFRQDALAGAHVHMIGAGGLGGEIGEGLVRKGVGRLSIIDPDLVELSNLNRQRFFADDLYQNKAVRLARNLQAEGALGTVITAAAGRFPELPAELSAPTLVVCGVDNNHTRAAAARYCRDLEIPAVFTAVSREADHGYVFIQEPDAACWGCLFPDAVGDQREPCPGLPAVKDVLKTMAGLVLYAVDSCLMERPRHWNYRRVFMDGSVPDSATRIERRAGCPVCADDGGAADG